MTIFAGLDVGDKATHVCVVDGEGAIVWRGACATDPEALAGTLRRHAAGLSRVVLETGSLSAFLYHGLIERGVPAICICARHAKGVLSTRSNKSDVHDAEGLAQLARTGWFKAVHIKDSATHLDRAQLKVREQLVKAHLAMANQLRGLLKLFGLRMGKATTPGKRSERLEALLAQKPALRPVLAPLVAGLAALEDQIVASSRSLKARAAADPVATRLMSVPGVGPITALTYLSSIEDPGGSPAPAMPAPMQAWSRDASSRASATPRGGSQRPAIQCCDRRSTKRQQPLGAVKRPSPLQAWGKALAETKAPSAPACVARKLAILLHRLWRSGTSFQWA